MLILSFFPSHLTLYTSCVQYFSIPFVHMMSTIVFNTICVHNVYKATQSDSKPFRATLSWSRTSKDFESCLMQKFRQNTQKLSFFKEKFTQTNIFRQTKSTQKTSLSVNFLENHHEIQKMLHLQTKISNHLWSK